MPNVGPIDGCRIATVARLPILPRASPRPTVVVVLPSPRGVGVIADTTTYFAFGRSFSSSIASSLIFATSWPYGSRRCGSMPILAATSGIGMRCALRAISRSVGKATFATPFSLSRQTRQHLLAPTLGRLDLVEREDVQARHLALRRSELRHQRGKKAAWIVPTRPEHARHPARMAAEKTRRVRHADLRRQA